MNDNLHPQGENPTGIVFVLDDDNDMRSSIGRILETASYNYELFATPSEFLERHQERFGCLLLDYQLPEMNGLELYEKLRSAGVRIPFVMISGNSTIPTVVDSVRQGAIDFLEKPFKTQALIACVERALKIAESQKEVVDRLKSLTPREREFLSHILDGLSVKQIAVKLDISPKTGHIHRQNIHTKMKIDSDTSLVNLLRDLDERFTK